MTRIYQIIGDEMKEKAILVGPCLGEFYWEAARFASHIIWKRKVQYPDKDIKFIVLTRNDRYDLYGLHVDKIFEFTLTDEDSYIQNGYRLDGFPPQQYDLVTGHFKSICREYDIIEHIYPDISKSQFCNKDQFSKKQMSYDFYPRFENGKRVAEYLGERNQLVVLAPRFRKKMERNWPYWQQLYDLIRKSDIWTEYTFIICGNKNSYVPDYKDRFLDINKIPIDNKVSLSGFLIEILKNSILTVGSQSAIPNLSLLLGTEVLEWGHQEQFHTVDYNPFNTPITFLPDFKYDVKPETVFEKMKNILEKRYRTSY